MKQSAIRFLTISALIFATDSSSAARVALNDEATPPEIQSFALSLKDSTIDEINNKYLRTQPGSSEEGESVSLLKDKSNSAASMLADLRLKGLADTASAQLLNQVMEACEEATTLKSKLSDAVSAEGRSRAPAVY